MSGKKLHTFGQRVAVSIGLFVLALVPRVLALDTFLTPDERRWLGRSVKFLAALLYQDWGGTLRKGHPGVTTMWTAVAGLTGKYLSGVWSGGQSVGRASLLDFLREVPTDMVGLDYLVAIRFPTVLLTSAFVVVLYLLVGKLIGRRVALLSAVLVALDPFYLAHSRLLHHDALVTTFMTLSLLSFLVYVSQTRASGYLVLSGLGAGLAFLSKATSLFLVPFVGLLAWMAYVGQGAASPPSRWQEGRRWLGRLLVWGLIAGVTFVALWPAMWVEPVKALGEMWEKATSAAATDVHTQGDFFLGRSTLDAKVLFYPMTLLFRVTPLSLVGAAMAVYIVVQQCRLLVRPYRQSPDLAAQAEKRWQDHFEGDSLDSKDRIRNRNLISLFLYMFLFTVFVSLGGIKYDRYLLPIYPVLEILAAEGVYRVVKGVKFGAQNSRFSALKLGAKGLGALSILTLILQAAFALPCYPYYLTYHNPMVGGSWLAPKMLLVGWGEGLDQAARYLNQQDGVEEKRVAVRFYTEFAPFYLGQTKPMLQEREFTILPWHASDYVVFYVTQVQRGEPDRATIDYFGSLTPEYVVRLNGINYAWIYPTPQKIPDELLSVQHVQSAKLDDAILFLGYDIEGEFKPGQTVHLTLFWQALQSMKEDYTVFTHLIDKEGNIWGQKDNPPVGGFYPTSQWEKGEVVRDQYDIAISPEVLPGEYRLEVGMYLAETGERLQARAEEGPLPRNQILLSPPVMIR
jgi:4-amino-4-deoxy-L-arabinose transferase-like glycosyltransferase